MAADDGETILGWIEKKDKALRYSVRKYEGHKFLDIRVFFRNGTGQMKATKEGITIGVKYIDEHIRLMNEASYLLKGKVPF